MDDFITTLLLPLMDENTASKIYAWIAERIAFISVVVTLWVSSVIAAVSSEEIDNRKWYVKLFTLFFGVAFCSFCLGYFMGAYQTNIWAMLIVSMMLGPLSLYLLGIVRNLWKGTQTLSDLADRLFKIIQIIRRVRQEIDIEDHNNKTPPPAP